MSGLWREAQLSRGQIGDCGVWGNGSEKGSAGVLLTAGVWWGIRG